MFKLNLSEISFSVSEKLVSKILNYKISKKIYLFFTLVIVALSVGTWWFYYNRDQAVAYNDARAHLDMARLVYDNLNPGFAQIGSVWLPLNHVLSLAFVWNDWMWHSGLAGSIFSMIFYILSSIVIFKLINLIVKDKFAAILGTLVFATNLNILYMQSTPMTELTLIFFFIATTYFLYKWVKSNKTLDLLYTSLFVFLATLTRYDGWFLCIVVIGVVFLTTALSFIKKKVSIKENISNLFKNWGEVEGKTFLFITLGTFGIVLWLLWNWAIFKDPLYFAYGPYSAHAQQIKIEEAGSLLTKYNLPLSIEAFWWAMVNNAGFLILVFSIVGFILYFFKNKFSSGAIVIYTLLVPLVFHVVSLYLGHSILVLPELGVGVTQKASASWFNVRYGLVILPAVSVFAAYFATKDILVKLLLIALLIIQPIIFLTSNNIITLTDGTLGTSSLEVGDLAKWMTENAKNDNGLILTSISFNNALAFSTGLPLKRFIHEGTGLYWETSLVNPSIYAKWIIMANGDVGDPVYSALINKGSSVFLKRFKLVKQFSHSNVYERIDVPENFTYTENREFKVNGEVSRFVGVNSYDLIYRTPEEINETISKADEAGIKVIRFWAFGDGIDHGIQPRAGIYNQDQLKKLDIILATAKQHDIKLIVTLVNYWSDYGGIAQYLDWNNLPSETPADLDKFYTDESTRKLFKKYIETILNRKNTLTGKKYYEDPTVFGWELANEPRSSNLSTSNLVSDWANEMSSFILTIDKSHLILTGTEGFLSNPDYTSTHTGPSFDDIASMDSALALTAHYYVQKESLLNSDFRHPVLGEWKSKADKFGKPMIIEEVGFSKKASDNNDIDRLNLYKNLFEEAKAKGIQGVILWNWALATDDNFGISPNDPGDEKLINLIRSYSVQIKQTQ